MIFKNSRSRSRFAAIEASSFGAGEGGGGGGLFSFIIALNRASMFRASMF